MGGRELDREGEGDRQIDRHPETFELPKEIEL